MKTIPLQTGAREKAWALLIVMGLAGVAVLLVASIMSWSNENSNVTARNSEYFATTYAAESAAAKAFAAIVQDDLNYGTGFVQTKNAAGAYTSLIPTPTDSSYWTNYLFTGGSTANSMLVNCVGQVTNIAGTPYSGLQYVGPSYEIIATAQNTNTLYKIKATIGQQVTLGQIPIFQFAIFYNDTMEIDPGAAMTINGVVHGNTNVYIDPNSGVSLVFGTDISASGTLNLSQNPLDPSSRPSNGVATFDGNQTAYVNPLVLPVGTNVSGNVSNQNSVYAILQVPPPGENANGTVGSNRLYNLADMIVTISNGNAITVTSGVIINNAATTVSNSDWAKFINTNGNFFNMRDDTEVSTINIDVGNLRKWSASNTYFRTAIAASSGRSLMPDVQSVYIVDQRFLSNTIIITNISSYTTNTTVTTTPSYPVANTYFPPVTTNTTQTTGPTYPTNGQYVPPVETTNTTSTTTTTHPAGGTYIGSITTNTVGTNSVNYPAGGTYSGSVTTNTSYVTNTSLPSPGTYTGTITTNKSHNIVTGYSYYQINGYTYNLIEYTYNMISGYIYNGITGYTYPLITGVTTNYTYITNYTEYAEPGIVLTNGGQLPSNGLSVATPDPLYIVGNWNCTNNAGQGMVQTYNVQDTLPSAVYADAVTVLSPAWNPNNSSSSNSSITTRAAANDTVNAAILTGIVPSNGTTYSGGVENFPRFQEDWGGATFYYNGSMVEMFTSQIANYPWPGTGVVYNPPTRCWAYDTNFNNPANLPPMFPRADYISPPVWTTLTPGTTSF